jgi:hypothetical protein
VSYGVGNGQNGFGGGCSCQRGALAVDDGFRKERGEWGLQSAFNGHGVTCGLV